MSNNYDFPYIIERYYAIMPDEGNNNYIAIIALIVSFLTFLLTYFVAFLNKKLDVKLSLFNEIILMDIMVILTPPLDILTPLSGISSVQLTT